MKNKEEAGVYQIRCLKNDTVYIGSTIWLDYRRKTHFYDLKRNDHYNSGLQSDYNKYGKKAFVFEVIHVVEGMSPIDLEDKLELLEIFYGSLTDTHNYNVNKIMRNKIKTILYNALFPYEPVDISRL
jgi:group I intron endonuclease